MKRFIPANLLVLIGLLLSTASAFTQGSVSPPPLPVDQAFQFSAAVHDPQTLLVCWQIRPGYYLYHERFHFNILKPKDARLGHPLMPAAQIKIISSNHHRQIYSGTLQIAIPIIQVKGTAITLAVNYQGCSQAGYCYPPTTKVVQLDLNKNNQRFIPGVSVNVPDLKEPMPRLANDSEKAQQLLANKNLWLIIVSFLGFGLLISLTPCVLPMIPILSAILAGQKKITTLHALGLSLSYVLGMAITYAIAGVLAGYIGSSLQAALQLPLVIVLFSLLFIAMALSLFGFYTIQLPKSWQTLLASTSQHQKQGTYLGSFIMGFLSTLILSPCVTPPLVGVLGYIGQTGNAALGGLALFTMAIGMGIPLLLIGVAHGKFVPKTGYWMNAIKNILGVFLLGVAIWMLQRIINESLAMLLWALLAIGTAAAMGAFSTSTTNWQRLQKGLGILIFSYGILLLAGALSNNKNPLKPIEFATQCITIQKPLPFEPVKTISEVKKHIIIAEKENKAVLLDFFAEWCISCKEMDEDTFSDPKVQQKLQHFVLLRADITHNNLQNRELQRYFHVVAPPTILFFKDGKEIKEMRIIGEMAPEQFLTHIKLMSQ